MSLHALLEYDCSRPMADDVVELCLFADCFHEMLQRDFGLQVLEILKEKKAEAEENEKKRKRDEEEAAAAKKAKLEAEESKEEEKKEEEKKEEKKVEVPPKPKVKIQHNVNQEILVPFQYFDKQPHSGIVTGSLRRDVLEGVMHQYGTMTKREIDELLLKGANLKPIAGAYNSPPFILYYIKIATTTTEVPIEEAAEEKAEEKKVDAAEKAEEDKAEGAEEPKGEDAPMEEAGEAGEAEADGAMTETSLNKLLLKDLRTMCQEKGLSTTGKKADLIERLLKGE